MASVVLLSQMVLTPPLQVLAAEKTNVSTNQLNPTDQTTEQATNNEESTENSADKGHTEETASSNSVETPDTEESKPIENQSAGSNTEATMESTEDSKPVKIEEPTTPSQSEPEQQSESKERPNKDVPKEEITAIPPQQVENNQAIAPSAPTDNELRNQNETVEYEQQAIEVPTDGRIQFTKETSVEAFISQIGESARKVGQENDLYASVMIAQAILESASGQSKLAQAPFYNLFGIKGSHKGKTVSMVTQEDLGNGTLYTTNAGFRVYENYEASLKDYALLLKEGLIGNSHFYEGVWKTNAKTYQEATKFLTGKYATDTMYNQKLDGLIKTYNLTTFDKAKPTIEPMNGHFPAYNGKNYDTGNRYAWGNCTQYVYNRITQLGGHVDLDMGNGQDWGQTGRMRGYEVSQTPKVGTAVSFAGGVLGSDSRYGHVAFLESIESDGSLLLSEMNVTGLNQVSTRLITPNQQQGLTYITPK